MGCALLMAVAALAPGVALLYYSWTWTGLVVLVIGLWVAGGALIAGWTDGGRRRNPWRG